MGRCEPLGRQAGEQRAGRQEIGRAPRRLLPSLSGRDAGLGTLAHEGLYSTPAFPLQVPLAIAHLPSPTEAGHSLVTQVLSGQQSPGVDRGPSGKQEAKLSAWSSLT